jgi:hypothetical protein
LWSAAHFAVRLAVSPTLVRPYLVGARRVGPMQAGERQSETPVTELDPSAHRQKIRCQIGV